MEFPRKDDFIIDEGYTYINAAYTHPIPKVALEAARRTAESRGSLHIPAAAGRGGGRGAGAQSNNPKAIFAELIGAKPTEIAYVPSTSFGENLAVQSLGLHKRYDGNVVTDGLHFEGALMHLLELKKRGLDVRIVKPTKDARIDMKDLEKAVDKNTRLIEISSAAMYNGFEHDLKAVSDLAHAHGALVYADIIHSAGTGPFDITASGVDFAACSTFKWLMGDFGIGFLYVREERARQDRATVIGYMERGRRGVLSAELGRGRVRADFVHAEQVAPGCSSWGRSAEARSPPHCSPHRSTTSNRSASRTSRRTASRCSRSCSRKCRGSASRS